MYEEIIKRAKRMHTLYVVVIVPVCIAVVLEFWFTNIFGLKEHVSLPMKLGASVLLIGAAVLSWKGYFKFNSKAEAMKQTVYASSDAEMENLLKACTRFERDVFINDRYVINFDSMEAYAIKEISKIEYEDDMQNSVRRYTLRLRLRESTSDFLHFDNAQNRDKAAAMLKSGM